MAYYTGSDVMVFPDKLFEIYVLGVTEGLQLSGADWIFECIDGWHGVQTKAVVEKYFRANPERWDEMASALVLDALVEACSQ